MVFSPPSTTMLLDCNSAPTLLHHAGHAVVLNEKNRSGVLAATGAPEEGVREDLARGDEGDIGAGREVQLRDIRRRGVARLAGDTQTSPVVNVRSVFADRAADRVGAAEHHDVLRRQAGQLGDDRVRDDIVRTGQYTRPPSRLANDSAPEKARR